MTVTPSGITTSLRAPQFMKAWLEMVVTPSVISTAVIWAVRESQGRLEVPLKVGMGPVPSMSSTPASSRLQIKPSHSPEDAAKATPVGSRDTRRHRVRIRDIVRFMFDLLLFDF